MTKRKILLWLALTAACTAGCAQHAIAPPAAPNADAKPAQHVIVIHDFKQGLTGVKAVKPDVKLSLGRDDDPEHAGAPTLTVEYPKPSDNEAARDVWCEAQNRDWRPGGAISFRVKPDHAVKLSVSFIDRNGVAYTAWVMAAQPGVWQTLHISLTEIRPNPYFQPPNAKTGAPLDVSEVTSIGLAPHDDVAGRFEIGGFVLGGLGG
ncbi:MAG TPA: carbohydrate binding domain-containing protein [Polyangiaceae bacterium]|jgi:hypothetical protein|nr:carbohydrate binding domain-containing protein [Polyangiaceae bacterium]